MAFLYDLLQGNTGAEERQLIPGTPYTEPRPVRSMVSEMSTVPPEADKQPPSWIDFLKLMAQQQGGGGMGTPLPQASAPVRPPTAAAPLQSPPSQSEKGLFGNSRKGFDLQSLMQLASLAFGGAGLLGAGAGAGAGAMGGGLPMGGTAAGAAGGAASGGGGGMGGMNPMSLLGGLGGGGGGGGSAGPRGAYAPLPQASGPLVPQSAAQWQLPTSSTWYG